MIEITPLDVRKKRGDFSRGLRGYDPQEVDSFLGLVADRLEELVKAHGALEEEVVDLRERVARGEGREQAVQEALVMAQELREEIRSHAHREAELIKREAEESVGRIRARAGDLMEERRQALEEVDRIRSRGLRELKGFLERELEAVEAEEERGFSFDLEPALSSRDGSSAPDVGEGSRGDEGAGSGQGAEPEEGQGEPSLPQYREEGL